VAALLIATGFAFYGLLRIPVPFRWRLAAVAGIFLLLIYGASTHNLPIPAPFYVVFGAIFMFRIIIYAYDVSHAAPNSDSRPRLLTFLTYFYILPNYVIPLFPVIDFQTMRKTYYQRDIHLIAQQGLYWMTRGAIQLALYRLVVYFNDQFIPDRVNSPGKLVATMVLTYLLYLNVSGHYHFAVGMLHLFGYDLPETNRYYLLASSLTDYWRRVNIYWKDFMVKIVYFPVYFKLRKGGALRAEILATVAVFLTTWALHIYQSVWLIGEWTVSWTDSVFWMILGSAVLGTLLYERRHKRRQPKSGGWAFALKAASVLGTFTFITTLWSMWSSPTFGAWFYLMTHWMEHGQ